MSPLVRDGSGLDDLIPRQPGPPAAERIRMRTRDVVRLLVALVSLLVLIGAGAAWFGAWVG